MARWTLVLALCALSLPTAYAEEKVYVDPARVNLKRMDMPKTAAPPNNFMDDLKAFKDKTHADNAFKPGKDKPPPGDKAAGKYPSAKDLSWLEEWRRKHGQAGPNAVRGDPNAPAPAPPKNNKKGGAEKKDNAKQSFEDAMKKDKKQRNFPAPKSKGGKSSMDGGDASVLLAWYCADTTDPSRASTVACRMRALAQTLPAPGATGDSPPAPAPYALPSDPAAPAPAPLDLDAVSLGAADFKSLEAARAQWCALDAQARSALRMCGGKHPGDKSWVKQFRQQRGDHLDAADILSWWCRSNGGGSEKGGELCAKLVAEVEAGAVVHRSRQNDALKRALHEHPLSEENGQAAAAARWTAALVLGLEKGRAAEDRAAESFFGVQAQGATIFSNCFLGTARAQGRG